MKQLSMTRQEGKEPEARSTGSIIPCTVALVVLLTVVGGQESLAQLAITPNGEIGVGTDAPTEKLHVRDGNLTIEQSGNVVANLKLSTNQFSWSIGVNPNTGRMTIWSQDAGATNPQVKLDPQGQANLLTVGLLSGDTVSINGKLVINGTEVTPDYVFDPDYPLESIEEHAALMWDHRRLPALPGAEKDREDGVDVVKQSMAILEELEKAHIYIARLNTSIKEVEAELGRLQRLSSHEGSLPIAPEMSCMSDEEQGW